MNVNLISVADVFIYLQSKFNKTICEEIFEEDSDHLFQKWTSCDYNIINFLSRLDEVNKQKLLMWSFDWRCSKHLNMTRTLRNHVNKGNHSIS